MNREELIKKLSLRIGSTKTEINKYLNGFIEIVQSTLKKEEEVNLIGFGKFHSTVRKAGKKLKLHVNSHLPRNMPKILLITGYLYAK